ncbi:MAG: hypothetical protein AABW58_03090 [Nanoarchaeota archaeon]
MKPKEIAMVIALAILTSFFFGLFVDAIYERPEYEDFCKERFREYPKIAPGANCVFQPIRTEQAEIDKCYRDKGFPEYNFDEKGCEAGFKECNFCQKDFDNAHEEYNRNVFVIIAPIGIILLVAGLLLSFEVVGTGLMFSGILLAAYATIIYFSDMSKWLRVLVIFIELVLLILISIKKLRK